MNNDLLIFIGTLPWVLFLLVVLIFCNGEKYNKIKYRNLFLFVFVFAAIRYGIGYDYFSYKETVMGNAPDYVLDRVEYLSRQLMVFSGKFHYQLFFAIASLLTIYPVYYVCKKISINPIYSFSVYLFFPLFFLEGLGVIRNAIAFSMTFLMFYCIYRHKLFLSVVFYVIAICFHVSAFAAFFIYPFYYVWQKKGIHLALYVISIFLPLFIMPILTSYFSDFFLLAKLTGNIEKEITQTGGVFYYIINGLALFNLYHWNDLITIREDNKKYLALINIGVCLWNTFLKIDPTTAERLSIFFLLFVVLLAPSYKYLFREKLLRFAVKSFFVLLFVASISLNLYAYYGLGREMSNIPYQVFFLNPSNAFYHVNFY